jgi:hypothetical protein
MATRADTYWLSPMDGPRLKENTAEVAAIVRGDITMR